MIPFLKWHLGLGDAIICAPLAVELARLHDGLTVPCYEHNLVSVRSLFVNHPRIEVIAFANEFRVHEYAKKHPLVIPIGFYKETPQLPGETFDRFFYRTAGVNFEHRWDPVVEKATEKVTQFKVPYFSFSKFTVFIHNDLARGFGINRARIEEFSKPDYYYSCTPDNIGSILRHALTLTTVDQVHVIDSSFLHLAESLPVTGALFLHRYARPTKRKEDQVELRKNWRILE